MHPALEAIGEVTQGTEFEGRLWLVGGAVRDELLGKPVPTDFDIVLESNAVELARFLKSEGVSSIEPVVYPRFGTALVLVAGINIELATARKESYGEQSRKPEVEPATLEEDAKRRDFTVNTLLKNLHTGELRDPVGTGVADLNSKLLRTPLDPAGTFFDDPLRMLRAVRFKWQLRFDFVDGLGEAIASEAHRLSIISGERIRDELVKMLLLSSADRALGDLMRFGLIAHFAPELVETVGVEQGDFHHLDVWEHSLLVVRNAGSGDLTLTLAALLHDIGKPPTRFVDERGNTRFFGHESVGATLTEDLLRRLKFPSSTIDNVVLLVKNHMRLGSAPSFSRAAIRRLIRDLDAQLPQLLDLVEADAKALRPGVRALDMAALRAQIEEVQKESPRAVLESPLSGDEIMLALGIEGGIEVGQVKAWLLNQVLDGTILPHDKVAAIAAISPYRLQQLKPWQA